MSYFKKIKFSMMLRSRKQKLEFFLNHLCKNERVKILDVGVTDTELSPYDNFLEKNYSFPTDITALSISSLEQFKKRYPKILSFVYDGERFPFEDNKFDVVHCNAVIEHVGNFERQVKFLKEMSRVGKKLFFATPAREFPLELHTNTLFLHYLPKQMLDKCLGYLGKHWATGDYMNLLSRDKLTEALKSADIVNYKLIIKRFVGLPLHYYIIAEK